jgi:hypothetical protein
MAVMRRIFYQAGIEGRGLCSIRKQLNEDGMPSPAGKAQRDLQSIRKLLKRELYRPHTLGTLPLGGSVSSADLAVLLPCLQTPRWGAQGRRGPCEEWRYC